MFPYHAMNLFFKNILFSADIRLYLASQKSHIKVDFVAKRQFVITVCLWIWCAVAFNVYPVRRVERHIKYGCGGNDEAHDTVQGACWEHVGSDLESLLTVLDGSN